MSAIQLTSGNFQEEVISNTGVVVVDFGASWCGPCQMLAPVMEVLADEYIGKVKIGKVDIDNEIVLARNYRVLSVPTVVLYKAGVEVDRVVGYQTKEQLEAWINKN